MDFLEKKNYQYTGFLKTLTDMMIYIGFFFVFEKRIYTYIYILWTADFYCDQDSSRLCVLSSFTLFISINVKSSNRMIYTAFVNWMTGAIYKEKLGHWRWKWDFLRNKTVIKLHFILITMYLYLFLYFVFCCCCFAIDI